MRRSDNPTCLDREKNGELHHEQPHGQKRLRSAIVNVTSPQIPRNDKPLSGSKQEKDDKHRRHAVGDYLMERRGQQGNNDDESPRRTKPKGEPQQH